MGKRKGVKANSNVNKNKNGNGNTAISNSASSSSTSMKMSRRGNETTDNKIGGGNSNKRMKRGESSNSCAGQSQSVESSIKEISIDTFPPENTSVNANVNEQPSTSSLYWTRSRKEAPYPELKELEFTKKGGKDEAVDEEFTEGPINDLPPEMLTKILKNVDNCSLFDCRLVSRQWLEISSQVITQRTDSILKFKVYDLKQGPYTPGISSLLEEENCRLQEFVNCMKKCKNIPYAHFYFWFSGPSFFANKIWAEFLSVFAPSNSNPNPIQNQRTKIKSLLLRGCGICDTKDLLLFTETLRDLLLRKIPRLEELGSNILVSCKAQDSDDLKNIELFPPPNNTESELTATTTVKVQLPHLKVLYIDLPVVSDAPQITRDLLNAAVNLTRIHVPEPCWTEGAVESPTHIFQFLHSVGKLHLLKKVEMHLNEAFLSDLKNSTNQHPHSNSHFSLAFKAQKLKLEAFEGYSSPTFYAVATNFLSNLLKSSKDTVEEAQITPLGFLHGLQFPKFTKLKTLRVLHHGFWITQLYEPLFPPGIKSKDIFPVVEYLSFESLSWAHGFPQEDSIPIFPSVHTFCIKDAVFVGNAFTQMSLMCPNLKHLVIQKSEENSEEFDFFQVGRSIWTHLNQLESLEVDLETNSENHAFPALDSCFTGISMENCQRLHELMEAEKTKNKNSSPVKLPESEELKKLTQREHPSILDMTNLKTLTIKTYAGRNQGEPKQLLTPKITWISEEYAFKLIPQLQLKMTME